MPALKDSPASVPKTIGSNGPACQCAPVAPHDGAAPARHAGRAVAALRRFAREIDRFFEDAGTSLGVSLPSFLSRGHELVRRGAGLIPAEWSPRIDMVETAHELIVRADLPGLPKEDVEVVTTDGMLVVHGERKRDSKNDQGTYLYNECSYGGFYRAIPLPRGADTSRAAAVFSSGVLEVSMPLVNKHRKTARHVEIHHEP